METNTIVTLCLGIGTILASGVMSSVVTYRLTRSKEQSLFMRTKAEILYLSADEFGRVLGVYTLQHYPLVKNEITWNEFIDLQIKSGSEKSKYGGFENVNMLAEVYFPTVRSALIKLNKEREAFNTFSREMKRFYLKDGGELETSVWMPILDQKSAAIEDAVSALLKDIISAARSYAGIKQ